MYIFYIISFYIKCTNLYFNYFQWLKISDIA